MTSERVSGGWSRVRRGGWAILAVVLAAAAFAGGASAWDDEKEENPYLAPAESTPEELSKFLVQMSEMPKTLRSRSTFQEAVLDAADRLAAKSTDKEQKKTAILAKFDALFHLRDMGVDDAQSRLVDMAGLLKGSPDKDLANEAGLVLLEDKVRETDLGKPHQLPALLTEVRDFFVAQPKLGERHLDLASLTVRTINAVEDDLLAYDSYIEFGSIFAKSEDAQLKAYGEKLKDKGESWALLKKPLSLEGEAIDGTKWTSKQYEGKVYLIDFWATWCGPCMEEVPGLVENYRKYHAKGFEIVGVSLDEDEDALRQTILEKGMTWPVLFAKGGEHPLATKFKVKAIPNMILVGKDGRILKLNARGETLTRALAKIFDEGGPSSAPETKKPAAGPIP